MLDFIPELILRGTFDSARVQEPQICLQFILGQIVAVCRQLTGHVFGVRTVVRTSPRLHVDRLRAGYYARQDRRLRDFLLQLLPPSRPYRDMFPRTIPLLGRYILRRD